MVAASCVRCQGHRLETRPTVWHHGVADLIKEPTATRISVCSQQKCTLPLVSGVYRAGLKDSLEEEIVGKGRRFDSGREAIRGVERSW